MYFRCRHLRKISSFSSRFVSGHLHENFQRTFTVSVASLAPSSVTDTKSGSNSSLGEHLSRRYSTVAQERQPSSPHFDLLSNIKSAIDELQGPSHRWLNLDERDKSFFKRKGTYLVLAGHLLNRTSEQNNVFEKLKFLQQRYPDFGFMGIHYSNQDRVLDDRTKLCNLITKEYLTFPILQSTKESQENVGEVSYILFRDFENLISFHESSMDISVLNKALDECLRHDQEKPKPIELFSNTWSKQADDIKESHLSSPLQDLLLYYPGCISADRSGDRLFLSDSNHHRIIVSDIHGKIMDSIGCCPGFEDGEFESAKMLRPAASIYDEDDDCLYIVDSENHAIRRADMEKRVLETVYPRVIEKKTGLWSWIMEKLGLGKDEDTTAAADVKSDEFDPRSLMFPWHILKHDHDGSLLVINKSFQKLWILNLAEGEIKEVVEGSSKIVDICEQFMTEKLSILKHCPSDWLQQHIESFSPCKELPHAPLLSSFTDLRDNTFMVDIAEQRVLKLNRESGACSTLQFSNLGVLGLPYWLSIPLERVYTEANGVYEAHRSHYQRFRLLPGKIKIRLNIEIPQGTELVEPLQGSCVWRQARGAAIDISDIETVTKLSDKVGVSQLWYDELDTLAFETPEGEEETKKGDEADKDTYSEIKCEDKHIHVNCTVNTSPGTSTVVVYAALYLRLVRKSEVEDVKQEELASKVADIILNPDKNTTMMSRDMFVKLLAKPNRDVRDVVFMKAMNVSVRLNSMDHPKAENSRDIILTDSSIEVNVSL